MKPQIFLLLGLVFVFEVPTKTIACDSSAMDTAIRVTSTQVELDIFSGREAPNWSLSAAEVKALLQMMSRLPSTAPTEFRDNLGYRGFTVKLPASLSGITSSIKVFEGIIRYQTDNQIKFFTDSERQVERWLLLNSKPHIPLELYTILQRESKLTY